MKPEPETLAIVIGRLSMAAVDCFHGLATLPQEQLTANNAFTIFRYVIENMRLQPQLSSRGQQFENKVLDEMKKALDAGPDNWAGHPPPSDLLH